MDDRFQTARPDGGRSRAPEETPPQSEPRAEPDPTLQAALLDVFRHIELGQQLQELLPHAAAWTGATSAYAFAPDDETPGHLTLAAALPEGESRGSQLVPPTLDELRRWGPDGERVPEAWRGEPPGSVLALAVRTPRGEPAGLLVLVGLARPGEAERGRARRLVAEAAPAIANALQVRAIRNLVIQDDTAACFNRRYFNEFLQEELARSSRFRGPLSLIFFDMDNLKEVNRRFGHSMGSRTLWEVSSRVRAKVRKFDKLFRFGGDEFCIVLPETEWHGALEVAERVREAIAGRPFLVGETADGQGVSMSASIGIASFPLHARTREELVQRADRAMQQIKNGAKNSIAIAEIAGGGDAR